MPTFASQPSIARARDVRLADLRIVLGERALDQRRRGLRQLAHHLGELAHRVLVGVADVARIAVALHEELVDPLDLVRHVAEAARLRAVAVERDRLVAQRLHDEVRHDAPVARTHARAVRVEDAHDARVDAVEAVIRHRQRLGEALGLVVHAARADGVHVAPVRLGLRVHERIAVHLARGREEEARALLLRQAERVVRAERAHLERRDRQLEIVDRARRTREVEHAVELPLHVRVGRDVVLDELVAAGCSRGARCCRGGR